MIKVRFHDSQHTNDIAGVQIKGTGYDMVLLRWVLDQKGNKIDIDLRLELSGVYDVELVDEIIQALILAKAIRQQTLHNEGVVPLSPRLRPHDAVEKDRQRMLDVGNKEPQPCLATYNNQKFRPTVRLLHELFEWYPQQMEHEQYAIPAAAPVS